MPMGFFAKLFGSKQEPAAPARPSSDTISEATTVRDAWAESSGVPQEMAASEALELYNSPNRPVFLDVREPHELEASGYIPESIHIPMDDVESRLSELNPDLPIIVYCASGMRSMDLGAFLIEKGFKDVSNLNGGLANWPGPVVKKAT